MINVMQLLQQDQARNQLMAQRAQQFDMQRKQIEQNMLAKSMAMENERRKQNAMQNFAATGNINALAAVDPRVVIDMQNAQRKERLMRDQMAMRGAKTSSPKPVWDQTRGVFVIPPDASGRSGIIKPEGLPQTTADRKAEVELEKEGKRLSGALTKADIVINKANDALGKVGFFTTGLTGKTLGNIAGTKAYDLEKDVETIKANLGFKELQDMREASPTGGALGQVAVQELNFLQAALANLDTGQSEPQLKKNLNAVKTHFENWKKAVGGKPTAPAKSGASGGWSVQVID